MRLSSACFRMSPAKRWRMIEALATAPAGFGLHFLGRHGDLQRVLAAFYCGG
jgi:hypothetical protein